MKCHRCGRSYKSERKSSKYCSDTCKTTYYRHGSIVNEEMQKAEAAIARLCEILDTDRKWWGREVHTAAMLIHVAQSKLYARTDFLTQEELKGHALPAPTMSSDLD